MHFLLTFQEVMPISKTRNQLIGMGRVPSGAIGLQNVACWPLRHDLRTIPTRIGTNVTEGVRRLC